ncbi:CLCA_X family protein [Idiomarina xiamenensis]|uniref:Large polyvalent protein-associated domain-containing protein n=1 Tax=Idiomarina xiamenensis 10-D-4 TaxID=740709 RepID=K2KQK6_9GAMM|nr:CLCA_X family protein [Idiomarina xiamenensis]EKE84724.1 hypothetical protein A10D4_03900 [Idiomarina xiamenensis 10-D-4]
MAETDSHGRIHKPYYRNGANHRAGADVSFADIRRLMGFRTISIGRWVSADEQQLAANLFFDALCDLQDILQVPYQVLSLNGHLSLSFGRGGRPGAAAHYEPAARNLALAKNAGGGALAHEWFHAFDHYISARFFSQARAADFASSLWLQHDEFIAHPLNQRLHHWFKQVFLNADGTQPNALVEAAIQADRERQQQYYALPAELAARAFEAVVQDQPIRNAFLVKGTRQSPEAKAGLYPLGAHRQRLRQAAMSYFNGLGQLLS